MRDVTEDPRLDDMPLLDELMPWSVAPLRLGRSWIVAPDVRTLRTRWDRLTSAGAEERERLFRPSRARTTASSVAALPGQRTGTGRFARESGPCPAPVRLAHGPFDEQWLLPDHRLIDAARPELWRVADAAQLFVVEQGYVPGAAGPALLVTGALPDGRSPAGRPGRIRPLFRRPGGREPNVAPGLRALLTEWYRQPVSAADLLAWVVASALPSPTGCRVPLPRDPEVWRSGMALGRRLTDVQLRGAHSGEKPRLPGGRRPYVRAPLPGRPGELSYDVAGETLIVAASRDPGGGGSGRISPVPAEVWDFHVSGARMLEQWFAHRTAAAEPGSLEAIGPAAWPQEWTSELLELITILALLARSEAERGALARRPGWSRTELRAAGILPVPGTARRPASVLDHHEEGPEGQFALL
ncbi:type ISP restriction/modification enzyme [Streptomyces sp. NBC_01216]|uniref:type ISP restriction/modification enzyme n=1 Tax=unclassified Streptomyces TaxID=2593676 RepID=UPI002E105346|nr:DNA methyltransferase [Streptomyces sp. NBC_01216]